jgi:hypothetical protein
VLARAWVMAMSFHSVTAFCAPTCKGSITAKQIAIEDVKHNADRGDP